MREFSVPIGKQTLLRKAKGLNGVFSQVPRTEGRTKRSGSEDVCASADLRDTTEPQFTGELGTEVKDTA